MVPVHIGIGTYPNIAGMILAEGGDEIIRQRTALPFMLPVMLHTAGKSIDHVISMTVDYEELLKRVIGRLTCRECGRGYHLVYDPPAIAGKCTVCSSELYQRDDDRDDTMRARLMTYETQTAPLTDYYSSLSLLRPVNGLGSIPEINDSIVRLLEG